MPITPCLLYEDCDAALEFLTRAFGFEEVLRHTGPGGYVDHAELRLGEAIIYIGDPGDDYRNPTRLGATTVMLMVGVDDVAAALEQAREAGAQITQEPVDEDFGDRRFAARDPEGHEWHISQRVREVAPEDWGATTPG